VHKHAAAVAFHSVKLQNPNIFQTAWRDFRNGRQPFPRCGPRILCRQGRIKWRRGSGHIRDREAA